MNILHIFTDQQRFDTIGALGNGVMRTPALDRLCREGAVFREAFTPSPVCVPARACMTSGLYPQRTGCLNNGDRLMIPEEQTFMTGLREAGYETHGIGKCHFVPDPQAMRGFQQRERSEEIIERREDDDYALFLESRGYGHVSHLHGMRSEMYYVPQPSMMPAELHPTQWVGDRTVSFLEDRRDSKHPWYLYAGFIHPHPPFALPAPWSLLYRACDMPLPHLPPDYEELQYFILKYQNRYKYRDRGLDLQFLRTMKAFYYGAISFIDYQVGRILEALEENGQLDNTLIIYTADHGEYLGDYGCFGKRGMHDVSVRIPMVVRCPEYFSPGTVCEEPVSLIDLAPTFLKAAGAQYDAPLDGIDLMSVAEGTAQREFVFSQYNRGASAVYMAVNRDWKYVYSATDGKECLFDRKRDPGETRNCLMAPGKGDIAGEMKACLLRFLKNSGHIEGIDGNDWKHFPPIEIPTDPDAYLLVQDPEWADFTVQGYSDPASPRPLSFHQLIEL
jgi:arylsulfatase